MSGVIPAIPLIIIRPFLPESKKWAEKRAAGTLKRPNILELFSAELRQTTLITTILFACSLGAAFGAIQQLTQIIPGVPEVQAEVKEALNAAADKKGVALNKLTEPEKGNIRSTIVQKAAAHATKIQEVGGLVGRIVLAILAVIIVSRRSLLRIFQIPGLLIMPLVFAWAALAGINYLHVGDFGEGY